MQSVHNSITPEMATNSKRLSNYLVSLPTPKNYIFIEKLYRFQPVYHKLVNAWLLNDSGVKCLEAASYEEAAAKFEGALALWPTNTLFKKNLAGTYNILGLKYDKLRNYKDALSSYENAVKLWPLKQNYKRNLANIRGHIARDQKEYDVAIKHYEEALSYAVDNVVIIKNLAVVHYELGCSYFAAKRYLDAEKRLEKAVALDNSNNRYKAALANTRGYIAKQVKRYEEAIGYYHEAISCNIDVEVIKKNLVIAYYEYGMLNFNSKDYDDALECFFAVRKYSNNKLNLNPQIGACYVALGDQDAANKEYYMAVNNYLRALEWKASKEQLKTHFGKAYHGIGAERFSSEKYSEALYYTSKAYKRLPENEAIRDLLQNCYNKYYVNVNTQLKKGNVVSLLKRMNPLAMKIAIYKPIPVNLEVDDHGVPIAVRGLNKHAAESYLALNLLVSMHEGILINVAIPVAMLRLAEQIVEHIDSTDKQNIASKWWEIV